MFGPRIFDNSWINIVFEGKNKEYGAYKLRSEEGATTAKAFLSALVFLTALALLPVLFSSFTDKPVIVPDSTPLIDDSIHVVDVKFPPKESLPLPLAKKSAETPTTVDLINPVVVAPQDATPVDITTNVNLGQNTNPNPADTGGTGGSNTGLTTTVTQPDNTGNGDTLVTTNMVEKSPVFPGGIDEFLRIVGNRFKTPEADEEGNIRVIVFFVVEKDGTLSNITVPRNPGFGLDKEAIRVLKSIKTKWEPGVYKGHPVRTQYSLPILVQMQ